VNEAAFYILDGEGYEVHDGIRYDWKAGDVAIGPQQLRAPAFQREPHEAGARPRHQDEADVHVHEHALPAPGRAAPERAAPGGEGFTAREAEDDFNHSWSRSAVTRTNRWRQRWHGVNRRSWNKGTTNQQLYQALLEHAAQAPARNAKRKKVVHPEDMPWELSRHGLLKHLLNEGMNTRMETVDAYMLIIPPGSRSGKHRQLAEECLYVLEGRGYDLHVDYDVEITDTYHWTPQQEVKRYEWEAGDVIYVPPNTASQHFNTDPERSRAPHLRGEPHLQGVRPERPRAARGRARVPRRA
jgi:quercetin dioxygenase-like cupin family protein